MGSDLPAGKIAVYFHHPFCLSLCPYCSFFKEPWSKSAQEHYFELLKEELRLWKARLGDGWQAASVYFGGGTPSLLEAPMISKLCAMLDYEPQNTEITLEINPIQITQSFLDQLVQTPVNRISLGIQSMQDKPLCYLGRKHRAAKNYQAVELLRQYGYQNLSFDLIYGLPDGIKQDLQADLQAFLSLEPEHISTYLLTLEPDSALQRQIDEGGSAPLPDDETCAAEYELICQSLETAGFIHYEISNFARAGKEGKHNLSYWHSDPYLGIGASASGWLSPWRYANPSSLEQYSDQINESRIMPDAQKLSLQEQCEDALMMGLRLAQGIDLKAFDAKYGNWLDERRLRDVQNLQEHGLLILEDGRMRLSPSAFFISNAVIGDLL